VEVANGEIIVGGVVMNAGCPALKELAGVRKHAKITNPTAEASLRRRKARTWRLTRWWVAGSMADLAVFIGLFDFLDLNEVQFLLTQVLCLQTHIMLT
jgi:Trk K+ transport system NAD-binding subunit